MSKVTTDIYWTGLFILVPLVALAAGHQVLSRRFWATKRPEKTSTTRDADGKELQKIFLRVYLIVMASEWLQGPYTYSLFRDEKGLDEQTVAALYITMYISAAVSAFFTGFMADTFGRRAACLVFCGIHSLASISVKSDAMEILVAGRVLSGIGLNLLWTTFESWMVTEYNARGLDQTSFSLSTMFGIMTKYNCITAILAGVLGHCVVLASGSKTDPFIIGAALDTFAALLMLWTWNENKGTNTAPDPDNALGEGGAITTLEDPRIWVLSFASCCFEGAIFIFTFFWPGALQDAHHKEHPGDAETTPYGVVFATFMAAMALGTLLFGFLTREGMPIATEKRVSHFNATVPTILLGTTLFISALSFLVAALSRTEINAFLAFLLLESCNGVYVPSMAYYRSMVVDDSRRALVYGLMNVPLFVFVVIALHTTSSDGAAHRQIVFLLSALLLVLAAIAVGLGLHIPGFRLGFQRISGRNICDIDFDTVGKDDIAVASPETVSYS
ncbi:MFS general substrate transporter [Hypoxylon sp. NC1633]|nr:MFS general substrate transporter [Hypoxylon sp. NC1633]